MKLAMADASCLRWLVERTSAGLTPHAKGLAVIDKFGATRGVVAYDCWTAGGSVQAHMAVDTPIAWRSLLPHVFVYPFQHAETLLGIIPADNRESNRMVGALGFREEHRIVGGWKPGVDLIVWSMRRGSCRYLSHGPKPRPSETPPETSM